MTARRLSEILARFPRLSILVVGDCFVDRYFDVEPGRAERSLETYRTAHQVTRVRTSPGGGGNVVWNLSALGARRVAPVTVIGGDSDGLELKRLLRRMDADLSGVIETSDRMTPSYNKPMLVRAGRPPEELDRLDVRSRAPMPAAHQQMVIERLDGLAAKCDGVLIADQVPERDCGVVTARVRRRLAELARAHPARVFFADSRCRIAEFRNVILKPNRLEAAAALGHSAERLTLKTVEQGARCMSRRTGRPVFVTLAERGCLVVSDDRATHVPTYYPPGPLDIVGAGDSFASACLMALCAGASPEEAALIGNLAASITIQQIGITGVATRNRILRRFREYARAQRAER